MNNVIEMLEAMVSQGEAQFKCGDKYATFNLQAIVRAREVLDQCPDVGVEISNAIRRAGDWPFIGM